MYRDSLADLLRLEGEILVQDVQHREGIVDSADLDALARDGEEDAAGAAGDFQNWTAGLVG